jgi:N,N'-diacetyllegionaminate synthase
MASLDEVMIITEIGGNHEGDFDYARRLLQLAAGSGTDVVKFQIYSGETLVNRCEDPQRVAHFNRFALTTDQYLALARECDELGVQFNASIWDASQIEIFDPFLRFYKVGSGDLTAYPLLQEIARRRKPIVLSTGLATLEEVRQSVSFIRSLDSIYEERDMLAILQCTSMYPIPDRDANLNVMSTIREAFKCKVGYSDHTVGTYAAEIAVALGAEILELHFTDKRDGRDFRDHQVSFTREDIKCLRERIELISELKGSFVKAPTASEIESNHLISFRRAVYPARAIKAGERIARADLTVLRPCQGIPANEIEDLLGRRSLRDLNALERLSRSDFE